MRTFCHISEFTVAGARLIEPMLLISENATFWAPSASLLDEQAALVGSPSSDDILSLVKDGSVRVIGRRSWWNKDARKDHPYLHARWSPMDDQLLALAIQDDRADLPPSERRVAFVEEEAGWDKANELLRIVDAPQVRLASDLLAQERLPPGLLEKAARQPTQQDKLRAVLRDVFNHEDAFVASGAELSVEPSEHGAALTLLHPNPGSRKIAGSGEPRPERLSELLGLVRLLSGVSKAPLIDRVRVMRSNHASKDVLRELRCWLSLEHDPEPALAGQLQLALEEIEGKRREWPKRLGKTAAAVVVGELILAALHVEERHLVTAALSVLFAGHTLHDRLALTMSTNLPVFPFLLAYGSDTQDYKRIKSLAATLRRRA